MDHLQMDFGALMKAFRLPWSHQKSRTQLISNLYQNTKNVYRESIIHEKQLVIHYSKSACRRISIYHFQNPYFPHRIPNHDAQVTNSYYFHRNVSQSPPWKLRELDREVQMKSAKVNILLWFSHLNSLLLTTPRSSRSPRLARVWNLSLRDFDNNINRLSWFSSHFPNLTSESVPGIFSFHPQGTWHVPWRRP